MLARFSRDLLTAIFHVVTISPFARLESIQTSSQPNLEATETISHLRSRTLSIRLLDASNQVMASVTRRAFAAGVRIEEPIRDHCTVGSPK